MYLYKLEDSLGIINILPHKANFNFRLLRCFQRMNDYSLPRNLGFSIKDFLKLKIVFDFNSEVYLQYLHNVYMNLVKYQALEVCEAWLEHVSPYWLQTYVIYSQT